MTHMAANTTAEISNQTTKISVVAGHDADPTDAVQARVMRIARSLAAAGFHRIEIRYSGGEIGSGSVTANTHVESSFGTMLAVTVYEGLYGKGTRFGYAATYGFGSDRKAEGVAEAERLIANEVRPNIDPEDDSWYDEMIDRQNKINFR